MYETIYQSANHNAPRKRTRGRGRRLTTTSPSKLTPEFWSRFVEQYWGQRPLVIKQPFATPLTTSDEMFSAIKNASEQFRAGGPYCFFRFYTEEGFLLTGPKLQHYIPETSDLSPTDYVAWVMRLTPLLLRLLVTTGQFATKALVTARHNHDSMTRSSH